MKRGFKKRAEEKSIALRKALDIDCRSPVNCFALANHLKITVVNIETLSLMGVTKEEIGLFKYGNNGYNEFSATILPTPLGNILIYNHFHSKLRTNSTLAHEISHIICNHDFSQTQNGQNFGLIREFPKEQEEEADWMAGCILLPRQGLVWAARNGMNVEEMAEHFQTSVKMANWRYNITGVKRQMCYQQIKSNIFRQFRGNRFRQVQGNTFC